MNVVNLNGNICQPTGVADVCWESDSCKALMCQQNTAQRTGILIQLTEVCFFGKSERSPHFRVGSARSGNSEK